jgi:hypothetical protein
MNHPPKRVQKYHSRRGCLRHIIDVIT